MTAPAAAPIAADVAAVDMDTLRENLLDAERRAWAHGRRCRDAACQSCVRYMWRSQQAFRAYAALGGEDAALDVLAGLA
ncbi:MAG: hypothetical protein IT537_04240 [Hyphomicrobiales bacterium]|nr:hypothetical protein [Hyphomicrobiales bacterium]